MMHLLQLGRSRVAWGLVAVAAMVAVATVSAQQGRPPRIFSLADGPWVFDTHEPGTRIRVTVVTRGLSHPWSLAFLPDGAMLVTEREGRLRIVRDGVLDPKPIPGVPHVFARGLAGLMDVVLHPNYASNSLIYLVYSKGDEKAGTTALARGRFDGKALTDAREIFVADAWAAGGGSYGSRIAFGRDGLMYVTIGHRAQPSRAQDPSQHAGTILRLRDDGTVPPDNPFAGKPGYRQEIYSYGHRNQQGLAFHPETGALWASEQGPNGGDEINIILAGRNYGWPLVTYGRNYDGSAMSNKPWQEGMEQPLLFWVPSIAASGMTFYTGDRFPAWKGNVFVGAMRFGEIPGTGHLERLVFSDKTGGELRREWLLAELRQRIRDVRQGPDGLLYVLTDEDAAALLRIEPAP